MIHDASRRPATRTRRARGMKRTRAPAVKLTWSGAWRWAWLCAWLYTLPASAHADTDADAASVEGEALGGLTPAPLTPPRTWLYLLEQRPADPANPDESIPKRYVVQWSAQPPTAGLNPDEFTLRVIERGGPLPPATRALSYALWPSCLRGPSPDLPQACANGEGGDATLDGVSYPFIALTSPTQAIFWSPTLGVIEDANLSDGVMTSRKLIGFDFGALRGGDTAPAIACDWRSSQRLKRGGGDVTLTGSHGQTRAALRCDDGACALHLEPSGATFPVGGAHRPTALKVWSHPADPGLEVVLVQGASADQFLMWALLLTPSGATPAALAYAIPDPDASFSALMMQRDRACTLQARLKVGASVRVDGYLIEAAGLSPMGEGSLRPLP